MEAKPEEEFLRCAVLMERWKIGAHACKTSIPDHKLSPLSLGLGSIQKLLNVEFLVEIAVGLWTQNVLHLKGFVVHFPLCLLTPLDSFFAHLLFLFAAPPLH